MDLTCQDITRHLINIDFGSFFCHCIPVQQLAQFQLICEVPANRLIMNIDPVARVRVK